MKLSANCRLISLSVWNAKTRRLCTRPKLDIPRPKSRRESASFKLVVVESLMEIFGETVKRQVLYERKIKERKPYVKHTTASGLNAHPTIGRFLYQNGTLDSPDIRYSQAPFQARKRWSLIQVVSKSACDEDNWGNR